MLQEALSNFQTSNSSDFAMSLASTSAILSIKPNFADAIFGGRKTFEYRRKLFRSSVPRRVFVYASAPISQVVGQFEIAEILSDSPSRLWARTKSGSGICRKYFFEYFSGCDQANAIRIERPIVYGHPIDLKTHFGLSRPPQSFCYV
jgi:predicted transcriptional regulator